MLQDIFTIVRQGQHLYNIDGSHRFDAMKNIRKCFYPKGLQRVTVLVHQNMSAAEATGIGFAMNWDDVKGQRKTDYEIVRSLRTVMTMCKIC